MFRNVTLRIVSARRRWLNWNKQFNLSHSPLTSSRFLSLRRRRHRHRRRRCLLLGPEYSQTFTKIKFPLLGWNKIFCALFTPQEEIRRSVVRFFFLTPGYIKITKRRGPLKQYILLRDLINSPRRYLSGGRRGTGEGASGRWEEQRVESLQNKNRKQWQLHRTRGNNHKRGQFIIRNGRVPVDGEPNRSVLEHASRSFHSLLNIKRALLWIQTIFFTSD